MKILAFDTATPETVVGLAGAGEPRAERHAPAPGERPGHAQQVLELARRVLDDAGVEWGELDRIGVGIGPGTFTGLRIGIATARALAQSSGADLVGVSTLEALASHAAGRHDGPVLAAIDARRGEAFVGAWLGGSRLLGPLAAAPDELAALVPQERGPCLAVGDGAIKFRDHLEPHGAEVPPDDSELHRVDGIALCRLAEAAEPAERDTLVPDYVREPDAKPRARA